MRVPCPSPDRQMPAFRLSGVSIFWQRSMLGVARAAARSCYSTTAGLEQKRRVAVSGSEVVVAPPGPPERLIRLRLGESRIRPFIVLLDQVWLELRLRLAFETVIHSVGAMSDR
jgi:hypothetical protein